MVQYEDIEDLTTAEIKNYPILFCKLTRATTDRYGKIDQGIRQVHFAVQHSLKITIPLRTISEIWPDSMSTAKSDLIRDSHYSLDDILTDDEKDMPILRKLVDAQEAQMFAAFEINQKRTNAHAESKQKAVDKSKKHRTGKVSKLPSKKNVKKHPKLDTFAENKLKQQEDMLQEFSELKEQFFESNKQVIEKNSSTYWPFIYEKFQSIKYQDYDTCLDEALEELEKLMDDYTD